jgi:hypothetical protein
MLHMSLPLIMSLDLPRGAAMDCRSDGLNLDRTYQRAALTATQRIRAWGRPRVEVSRLIRADYIEVVSKNFSRSQITWILKRASTIWPEINRTRYRVPTPARFARVAHREGIRLQASPYRGGFSLALRGFYADLRQLGGQRPMIFLNTAHHPAIIAMTWLHEMGHHLLRPLKKPGDSSMHFLIDAGYDEHLTDRFELAADVIVALAILPRREAARVFLQPAFLESMARPGQLDHEATDRVFRYASARLGAERLARKQRRRFRDLYFPEAVHFTKLRCALAACYRL